MSHQLSGNCACGRIEFEVKATKANVVNCHCNRCRKMNGSAFSTFFVVAEQGFKISAGEAYLSKYAPSENSVKYFCQQCGSPIFNQSQKYPNLRMVHLGGLNLLEEVSPDVNIFCESMLSWVAFNCEIPSFEQAIKK